MGYSVVDALVRFTTGFYRGARIELPVVHDTPVLSKTIAEFWARRWNRTVQEWLERHCFKPIARRGHARLGLAAAFAASAVLHAWLALVVLDLEMAAWMGAFFLVQGALVLLELALGVRRWPSPFARVWTVTLMLATSPLFIEPLVRFFEVR